MKKEWRLTPSSTSGGGGLLNSKGIAGRVVNSTGDGSGAGYPGGGAAGAPGSAAGSEAEIDDLKKIRKVQGFFRGWLCRHRWKVIVEEYIKSPHAESMRKRNRSARTAL